MAGGVPPRKVSVPVDRERRDVIVLEPRAPGEEALHPPRASIETVQTPLRANPHVAGWILLEGIDTVVAE